MVIDFVTKRRERMHLTIDQEALREAFGDNLQWGVPLARYTSARVGGTADIVLEAHSASELIEYVSKLWMLEQPFMILGGGSNVLISDQGLREVVLLNRASQVHFNPNESPPTVWAESGANFGALARQAARLGLAGLEWAAGIPGTLGGAIVGNAGAHSKDMRNNLVTAQILHLSSEAGNAHYLTEHIIQEDWSVIHLNYRYRDSILKVQANSHRQSRPNAVVLSAVLHLEHDRPETIQARIDELVAYRKRTQPPGASMGSMFKNPTGDYAGRLIEAAGLKGTRVGNAMISELHANFFINLGAASAQDIYALILQARQRVADKFGIQLELEIELIGDFSESQENQHD